MCIIEIKKKKKEKEPWICCINFGENLDSHWQKLNRGVSTVADIGNLGF